MAATSALLVGIGGTVANGVVANQERQKAKGQAAAVLAQRPDANALQQQANQAALDGQRKQRQKLAGMSQQNSTVLTSPSGITAAPPPAVKTLLGS